MRILGIDPGFGRVGWGIIEQVKGNDWKPVAYGCIETNPKDVFADRLKMIRSAVLRVIATYKPTRLGIEELFFTKNVTTGIDVAQARGVIILSAAEAGLNIDEFTPNEVKQATAGYGKANKEQMQKIVAVLLKLKDPIKSDDAADALAVAITAGQHLWLSNLK